jgi:alpha-tubulin suppressor-like RCC1 family protein
MRSRIVVALVLTLVAACTNLLPDDNSKLTTAPLTADGAKQQQPLPVGAISCVQMTLNGVNALQNSGVLTEQEATPLLNRLNVVLAQIYKDHSLPASNVADAYNDAVERLRVSGRLTDAQAAGITLKWECLVPVSISSGETHSCVLLSDNTVWCWGSNESGQLGDGTNTNSPVPVRVGGLTASLLDAGGANTCAVSVNGAAYCWGRNDWGQLGDGTTTWSTTPVAVAWPVSDAVAQVSVGSALACGRVASGKTYCWGQNFTGGIGSPATSFRCGGVDYCATSPVRITTVLTFSTVDVGIQGGCGLDADGAAYCWGARRWGATGDGDRSSACIVGGFSKSRCASQPVPVMGGYRFRSIEFGVQYVCGIRTDGPTMCWGSNDGGQLGIGTLTTFLADRPGAVVGDPGFTSLSAEDGNRLLAHVCGVDAGGAAYCWGWNDNGQLGAANQNCTFNGVSSPCATNPVAVTGGYQFKQVSVGRIHSCGITTDNKIVCWGGNSVGQLGDGTTTPHTTPSAILTPWTDAVQP